MVAKLKSRKFWVSLLSLAISITGALSGIGGDVGTVCCIIGAILAPIVYVLTEGIIDAKAIQLTVDTIDIVLEKIKERKTDKKE